MGGGGGDGDALALPTTSRVLRSPRRPSGDGRVHCAALGGGRGRRRAPLVEGRGWCVPRGAQQGTGEPIARRGVVVGKQGRRLTCHGRLRPGRLPSLIPVAVGLPPPSPFRLINPDGARAPGSPARSGPTHAGSGDGRGGGWEEGGCRGGGGTGGDGEGKTPLACPGSVLRMCRVAVFDCACGEGGSAPARRGRERGGAAPPPNAHAPAALRRPPRPQGVETPPASAHLHIFKYSGITTLYDYPRTAEEHGNDECLMPTRPGHPQPWVHTTHLWVQRAAPVSAP